MKHLTPRTFKTFDQLCEMPRDNITVGDSWMLVCPSERDFGVVICTQRVGEKPTGEVWLSRKAFAKMADWFNNGNPPRLRKKRNAPSKRQPSTR